MVESRGLDESLGIPLDRWVSREDFEPSETNELAMTRTGNKGLTKRTSQLRVYPTQRVRVGVLS